MTIDSFIYSVLTIFKFDHFVIRYFEIWIKFGVLTFLVEILSFWILSISRAYEEIVEFSRKSHFQQLLKSVIFSNFLSI